jgi:exosortase
MLPLAAVLASFAFVYYEVIYWLVDDWDPSGNYSHGYLVVPIAVYLAWERRAELRNAPLRPSGWGLAGLVLSMALVLIGTAAAETFVARVSMVTAIASGIWFVLGSDCLRILKFPLAFLLMMIPIPSIIFNQLAFPLQLVASTLGEATLSAAEIPVLREGNLIMLPGMTLEVAEACSGIRSLVSLSTLAILFGYMMEPRTPVRVLLVIATVPIAILVNGLRVAATGVTAHYYGQQFAEGFFHSTSGWALFVVAGAMLVAVHSLINVAFRFHAGRQAIPAGQTV